MVRSMYSGVSGMRSHQTRMDVIGNNIANVNTYGFKSSRATFRDIYYQGTKNASAGSTSRGGVNPSSVGVGTKNASIDVLQTRSTFTQTDYSMDVAIDGEGFFQIQDPDGNIYYTRSGQLNFDSAGNLVDSLGNFVLGVPGNPMGKAADSKTIQLNAGTVNASTSTAKASINGIEYTISSTAKSDNGNVGFQLGLGADMADGQSVEVDITTNSIMVYLNPEAQFASLEDLQNQINARIKEKCIAETGKEHPAGNFIITASQDPGGWPLTGEQLIGNNFGTYSGEITGWEKTIAGGFIPTGTVSSGFGKTWGTTTPDGKGQITSFNIKPLGIDADGKPTEFRIVAMVGGEEYSGTVSSASTTSGKLWMKNSSGEYFEINRPSFQTIMENTKVGVPDPNDGTMDYVYTKYDIQNALIDSSTPTSANKGNADTTLGMLWEDLGGTNTGSVTLSSNFGETWANTLGNPVTAKNLAMSNFHLDPIMENGTLKSFDVSMTVDGLMFTGSWSQNSNSLILRADGVNDTITLAGNGMPTWAQLQTATGAAYDKYKSDTANGGIDALNDPANTLADIIPTGNIQGPTTLLNYLVPEASASTPSVDVGLGTTKFNLKGGTAGGSVGMEDLTNVAIAPDGTITAEHSTLGTIYIGRIDLVTFSNPQALIESGNTYFQESENSGTISYCKPGTNGSGQLVSGSLELSNADLSKEFTDMITTQRGYQANSRVITVSDTMLEELVNLKR